MDRDISISSELEERQQDELASVVSIYGDILTDITPSQLVWNRKPSPHFQIFLQSDNNPDRPTISMTLDIEFTQTYPLTPPIVKVLNPKNLLKTRIAAIEAKIAQLIKEYPEVEVSFTIISEVKFMLDEFQSITEKVFSLEEERELRLRKERMELENLEAQKRRDDKLAKQKQNEDLNRQILQIKDEYYHQDPSDDDDDEITDLSMRYDDELVPKEHDPNQYFVFEKSIVGEIPDSRAMFKFKAVSGFIKYNKNDLLSSISSQYIVKPYLPREVSSKIIKKGIELSYLLTEIDFDNQYYTTEQGKRDMQDLERELQLILALNHSNIAKLYGFQIDRKRQGWKVRLLTEFSCASDSLQDILPTAEFINWGLARSWVIQLLPALEYLHNSGFVHKMLCPLTVYVYESEPELSEISDDTDNIMSTKIQKICHPSYGYRLLNMMSCHPHGSNESSNNASISMYKPKGPSQAFIPSEWMAPELVASGIHHQKTDIWDLGVLFMRVMLNYNILTTAYKNPQQFHQNFKSSDFVGAEQYAELIYDFLSKMLQVKVSKRPSPLELNAVKFLRDGPIIVTTQKGLNKYSSKVCLPQSTENSDIESPPASPNLLKRSTLGVTTDKRRYSNNQRPYVGDLAGPTQASRNVARYERDFEEVGKLGKGGFGEVVKARNKIEGTFYAIKKIKHKANKLDSLLSEVLSLARLNHQYIVRYYGTWVEEVDDDTIGASTDSSNAIESDDSDTDSESEPANAFSRSYVRSSHDNSFQVDYISHSFEPDIDFGSLSDENAIQDSSSDRFEFANSDDSGTISWSDEESVARKVSETTVEEPPKRKKAVVVPKSILYIQMEFCENNTLLNLIEQGLPGNPNEYWRLFRQLLEAVSYIHREGFIHRDLKPMNIFIDKSNNVKVGDFGLAKNSQFSSIVSNNNQVTSTNKDYSTIVGTLFYTAKEVASGDYSEKVDMYALGIILFEMCYSMSTGMERASILNNLRLETVEFPSNFVESRYKTEKKIIKLLLDHNPSKRPGASELLQSGWLPVEHQDQVIKEALKSLADPASPWQQQVRQTLFNQPYSLVKDLMFDNNSKGAHIHQLDNSIHDYLIFSKMIEEIFSIFKKHGAIEDFCSPVLVPKAPSQISGMVYEVLDKSGSVLTLPYDLVLPTARFLSRSNLTIPKIYRHEFVYRPNLRGTGIPDKYSTINFDVTTSDNSNKLMNEAECIKVVDDIIHTFPCFKTKNSQTIIVINHHDILDAILTNTFGVFGIDEVKRVEVVGVLSQLGIDKSSDEVKKLLIEDVQIPHTVTKELIDSFNFTTDPEKARSKIQKLMVDSPLLVKIEKSFKQLADVLSIVKKLGIKTSILMNPLSNYNSKYYTRGIMFQAIFKVDKNRRFLRIVTGGRYDSLIESFTNKDLTKLNTPHAVGFSLSSTIIFVLMKNLLDHKIKGSGKNQDLQKWRGRRCDVLITCLNEGFVHQVGYEVLHNLWANNISADLAPPGSQEEVLQRAHIDGANWILTIKQPPTIKGKRSGKSSNYKPLKIRNLRMSKDIDLEYGDLIKYLNDEILERDNEQNGITGQNDNNASDDIDSMSTSSVSELDPLFTVDLDNKVVVVPNDAPRGRKNNRREKWEIENDSKVASAGLFKTLSTSTIITVDVKDEVLDIMAITSIKQSDEWFRKVLSTGNNFPKSYAMNIYNSLSKEASKGQKWVILHSVKSQKMAIIDLERY